MDGVSSGTRSESSCRWNHRRGVVWVLYTEVCGDVYRPDILSMAVAGERQSLLRVIRDGMDGVS